MGGHATPYWRGLRRTQNAPLAAPPAQQPQRVAMGLGSFRDAHVELQETFRAAAVMRERQLSVDANEDDDAGSDGDTDAGGDDDGLHSRVLWLVRRALYGLDSAIASARWQMLVRDRVFQRAGLHSQVRRGQAHAAFRA
jgi:hypothetical protein